jgi:hypothetical protein
MQNGKKCDSVKDERHACYPLCIKLFSLSTCLCPPRALASMSETIRQKSITTRSDVAAKVYITSSCSSVLFLNPPTMLCCDRCRTSNTKKKKKKKQKKKKKKKNKKKKKKKKKKQKKNKKKKTKKNLSTALVTNP